MQLTKFFGTIGLFAVSMVTAVGETVVLPASPVRQTPAWAVRYLEDTAQNRPANRQFFVDSQSGDDSHDGQTPGAAWKTLTRVNQHEWRPGDRLLLKRGSRFAGAIALRGVVGTLESRVCIGAYGPEQNPLPLIDGRGCTAAVSLTDCQFVQVENLEICNDNGSPVAVTEDLLAFAKVNEERKWQKRVTCAGVAVTVSNREQSGQIHLKNLFIHTVFPDRSSPSEGKINATHHGYGIHVEIPRQLEGSIKGVFVEGCRIENTGHFGLLTSAGRESLVEDVIVQDNRTDRTGGSALLLARVRNAYVQGNVFNRSGAFDDGRKHGRGSGSWTFSTENVIYENNVFMNSAGKGDSTGVHIDFNCRNVVVQRNLSINNEGGFMEVLGNNYNCGYRYNISINDGARVKGQNGAVQEGKLLMVSGHCMKSPYGPFNSYFYNNTIYVKAGIDPKFAITHSADGLLIANNIFYLASNVSQVSDDQPTARKAKPNKRAVPTNVLFANNLYSRCGILPPDLNIQDVVKIVADPGYHNPGGLNPADYTPQNRQAVQDAGIVVHPLPGDSAGLIGGSLQVDRDYFGHPIVGRPDLGAIELPK